MPGTDKYSRMAADMTGKWDVALLAGTIGLVKELHAFESPGGDQQAVDRLAEVTA